ncbi:hypothetical protein VNO78_23612 [Psophocarpus tetragonolobus]|uniref:Single-stranded DNA-binding protein, mitochondrial n=1 Tax=Psophocarpus tetragonolobus TaxID=3891 RepID=A0AAN9XDY5_PSOTE
MSNPMMRVSRRVYGCLVGRPRPKPLHFSTNRVVEAEAAAEAESAAAGGDQRSLDSPLEDGLDDGIYKAILVGVAGQPPFQKKFKNGRVVTLLSIGTGGIHNNRRPLHDETPKDYANRSSIQWHRISVHSPRLGNLLVKHVLSGTMLYVEGNLETKVFNDPITGLASRIREIAVRHNGRVVCLGEGGDAGKPTLKNYLKAVGYY